MPPLTLTSRSAQAATESLSAHQTKKKVVRRIPTNASSAMPLQALPHLPPPRHAILNRSAPKRLELFMLLSAQVKDLLRCRNRPATHWKHHEPGRRDVAPLRLKSIADIGFLLNTAIQNFHQRKIPDWPQVRRFQVESCILFVESLLLNHFS